MKCDKCGKENKKNAKFCEECGSPLEVTKETKPQKDVIFCEKCGKKIEKEMKFCGYCGAKTKNEEGKKANISINLSNKARTALVMVGFIFASFIIILIVVLNDPIRKVNNYLDSYYVNYADDDMSYLDTINQVYNKYVSSDAKIEEIRQTIKDTVDEWIMDFNSEYSDKDELYDEYNKIDNILDNLYTYYDGIYFDSYVEYDYYFLSYDDYIDMSDTLSDLYYSKFYYLTGFEYENVSNDYYAYYYYSKVIESDSYYEKAQEFINNYLEEELDEMEENFDKILSNADENNNLSMFNAYLEIIMSLGEDYSLDDFSSSSRYKSIHDDAYGNYEKYAKLLVEEYANNYKYREIIDLIDRVKMVLTSDEIDELYEKYSALIYKLTDMTVVDKKSPSFTSIYPSLEDLSNYDSYIKFSFAGEIQYYTYEIKGEYTKLSAYIGIGSDWDESYSGYFVIYGDDVELYRSDEITSTSIEEDIYIDVTGVNNLTIEFVTEDGVKDAFKRPSYIYILEPYLYK